MAERADGIRVDVNVSPELRERLARVTAEEIQKACERVADEVKRRAQWTAALYHSTGHLR